MVFMCCCCVLGVSTNDRQYCVLQLRHANGTKRPSVRAANKANAMLGMINRAFKYKTKEVVLKLLNP